MPITVRTPRGELTYESLDSLWRALKAGEVAPHDDARLGAQEPWQKVGALPKPPRSLWQRLNPWNAVIDLMGAKRS